MISEINVDRHILGGTPVFRGTRVPIAALFDYMRVSDSLDEFLLDFPSVRREQAESVLREVGEWTRQVKVAS